MKDYMLVPVKISNIQYKKEDDGNEYAYIDGYSSFYKNIDLGGDRVMPGFFTEDLEIRGNKRPALWQHSSKEPVGVKFFTDSDTALKFTAKLPMADTFVTGRVLPQVEVGSIQGASIGYSIDIAEYNSSMKCRDLIKGRLHESSFVTFPMNPKAIILSMRKCINNQEIKSNHGIMDFAYGLGLKEDSKAVPPYKDYPLMNIETKWDKKKSVNMIRKKTNSEDGPGAEYKNGFMFYDQEKQGDFSGYKMPYVYFDNGEFKAVPKAIFSIAAALSGARGGVNIPDEDKRKIQSQINKYYVKMGREEPFKGKSTFVCLDTIKAFDKKDFDKLFDKDNEIILSKSAKEWIISKITHEIKNEDVTQQDDLLTAFKELNSMIKV